LASAQGAERPQRFVVEPKRVELVGNFARAQLVASVAAPTFTSSDRKVVRVDSQGVLYAVGNGTAEIVVTLKSSGAVSSGVVPSIRVPVTVKDVVTLPTVSYSRDVVPIISKAGCNMGACHASQYGKAGFKLSVFGYEPSQDMRPSSATVPSDESIFSSRSRACF
jgi:hypothetical protein